jgi:outer membrane receptor for ferrienterochelin and colicin
MTSGWLALLLAALLAAGGGTPDGEDTSAEEVPEPETIGIRRSSSTVTEALQGQEGVRIQTMCTHCNSSNIQVGGLNQELVPISRDGYPVLGGLATSLVFTMLPADSVADAKVRKGPGRAEQPASAAGGVIRLTEATPKEVPWLDLSTAAGEFGLRSSTLRAAGPLASWLDGMAVVGTTDADPVDDDGDGWHDVGAVDREFAEGRLTFTHGRQHTVDVAGSWIDEETVDARGAFDVQTYFNMLFAPNAEPAPAWTREDTLLDRQEWRATWEWRPRGSGKLTVQALDATRDQSVRSQETRDTSSPFSEFFERFEIKDDSSWGRVAYRHSIGQSWVLRVGVEGSEQEVSARTRIDSGDTDPDEVVDYIDNRSGFLEVDWSPGRRWGVDFGVRYDDLEWGARDLSRSASTREWSPRATIRFSPAPGWTLRVVGGRTTRGPRPIFAEVCCGQKYERSVDTRHETGTTFGFEGIFQPSSKLRTSVYLSRTDFDDHILRLVGSSFFYIQTYTLGNVPDARADTAEAAVRWSPVDWLSLDGSIGWLSFHNEGNESATIRVTPLFFTEPQAVPIPIDRIPYQPTRTGSVAASFRLPRGATIGAQAGYTGSMMIQQFADDPTALPAPPAIPSILLDDMRETPGFWLVNLTFQVPLAGGVDLFGAVDNLSDRIQNDLDDPTTDYNWGPLTGRAWRLGLRYHLDRN